MSKKKRKAAVGDVATNRQASFRYELLDKFEAGMVLKGTEVKALRDGGAQLKDAYAIISDGEVWLFNAHISPYSHGNRLNHDPVRTRKLLLNRREIDKLEKHSTSNTSKGLTLVVTRVYLKGGRVKFEIGVARGKKLYDKRETEMRRTVERETRAQLKERAKG